MVTSVEIKAEPGSGKSTRQNIDDLSPEAEPWKEANIEGPTSMEKTECSDPSERREAQVRHGKGRYLILGQPTC